MRRHPVGTWAGILLAGLLAGGLSTSGLAQREGRRLAIVVGNNAYTGASVLRACRNDARAIAAMLTELGFAVTLLEDATRQRLADALGKTAGQIRADDAFFFYFSGHGVQAYGENFLVPVDYSGDSLEEARLQCVSAQEVETLFQRAKIKVLVLDACRTNGYANDRAGGLGLAKMDPRGSLIAYATGANQISLDDPSGGNSPFTTALLEEMREPGLIVQEVFRRLRQRVYEVTNGRQEPAVYDNLRGDFILRPGNVEPPPATQVSPPGSDIARREELALWESIKDLKDRRVFEDYLQKYPNGRFKVAAEAKLAELGRAAEPPLPSPPPAGLEPVSPEAITLDGPFTLLLEKTASISDQKFLQFPDFETMHGYFQNDPYWKNGEYSITSVAAGNNGLLVVLSKLTNEAQAYAQGAEFPKDDVKKRWDEGYRITELSVVPGRWFVVMTKNSGYGGQNYWISETWPVDFIKKQWDAGQRITHARWRDGKYVVVTSEGQARKIKMQRWKKGWDDAWVKESRDKGLVISLVVPGNNETYYVMSEFEGEYDGFRLTDEKRFPAADLAQKLAEGYWVTFLY